MNSHNKDWSKNLQDYAGFPTNWPIIFIYLPVSHTIAEIFMQDYFWMNVIINLSCNIDTIGVWTKNRGVNHHKMYHKLILITSIAPLILCQQDEKRVEVIRKV